MQPRLVDDPSDLAELADEDLLGLAHREGGAADQHRRHDQEDAGYEDGAFHYCVPPEPLALLPMSSFSACIGLRRPLRSRSSTSSGR